MIENSNSNNIKNDQFNPDFEEIDYNNLISRLNEIKTNIASLEKILFE